MSATLTEVDKKESVLTYSSNVTDFSVIGGSYKSGCDSSGKYYMLDVEVFSTHAKGENGIDFEVDDAWIEGAYQVLEKEWPQHAIPVNIYHHEKNPDGSPKLVPVTIGLLQPVGTKKIHVNGKERLTLLGNIIGLSKYYFHQICELLLPYRSAEILSFRAKQIGALSLLRDEIGYFKYAMLRPEHPSSYEGQLAAPVSAARDESPLLAYASCKENNDNVLLLYKFGGNVKKDSEEKKKPEDSGKPEENKESGKPGDGNEGEGEKKGFPPKDKSDSESAKAGAGDPGAGAGAGEGGMQGIYSILAKIWKKVQNLPDTPPEENDVNGDKAPAQDKEKKQDSKYSAEKESAVDTKTEEKKDAAAAPVADVAKEDMKKQIAEDAKYAAKSDRAENAESKLKAKDREIAAIKALGDAGYRLSKDTKDRIAKYAAVGDAEIAEFVSLYKSIAEPDPPKTVDGAGVFQTTSADAGLPEDVLKYKATDMKEFEVRKALIPEFEGYKRSGGAMTFDRFVASEKQRVAAGGR